MDVTKKEQYKQSYPNFLPLSPPTPAPKKFPITSQVKESISQKDEDLELLRDAVQTEKVKISRLEKLLLNQQPAATGAGGRKRDAPLAK